jgi:hypothetical protein
MRLLALFLLGAIPVAAILVAVVSWVVGIAYVVIQTAFLMYATRQHNQPKLRLEDDGVQFEPGTFVIKAAWDEIDKVAEVTLPSGKTDAFVLTRSGVRWTMDPNTRRQVTSKGWDRVIPISDFEPEWRSGQIGAALRAHRPDLLPD